MLSISRLRGQGAAGLFVAAMIALPLISSAALAESFDYKNMLLLSIKLNPSYDYDNVVDSYMETFRAAVWQKVRNDEFQLNDKRAETLDMMKKAAQEYNINDPFVISTNFEFGEYDFKAQKL